MSCDGDRPWLDEDDGCVHCDETGSCKCEACNRAHGTRNASVPCSVCGGSGSFAPAAPDPEALGRFDCH